MQFCAVFVECSCSFRTGFVHHLCSFCAVLCSLVQSLCSLCAAFVQLLCSFWQFHMKRRPWSVLAVVDYADSEAFCGYEGVSPCSGEHVHLDSGHGRGHDADLEVRDIGHGKWWPPTAELPRPVSLEYSRSSQQCECRLSFFTNEAGFETVGTLGFALVALNQRPTLNASGMKPKGHVRECCV